MIKQAPLMWINGKPFPFPSRDFKFTSSQLVSGGRNENGVVTIQKINRRLVKFDSLVFPYLKADEWREIRKLIEEMVVDITYYDDYEDKVISRKFYFGDSSAQPFELDRATYDTENYTEMIVQKPVSYINCSVNIIDMGISEKEEEGE